MNTMYLVCIHHPDKADAFLLADRTAIRDMSGRMGAYSSALERPESTRGDNARRTLSKFFAKHATCGGGFDHFTVAFDREKDHDLPKPAPLADAVHAVLRDQPGAANDG